MIDEKVVKKAIKDLRGVKLKPGAMIVRVDGDIVYALVRYEDDVAVVSDKDGKEHRWPANDVVDAYAVMATVFDSYSNRN